MSDPFPWQASWPGSWPADWSISWQAFDSSPGLCLIHFPDQLPDPFPGQLTDPSLDKPLIHLLAHVWSISLTSFLTRILASWLIHLLAGLWFISWPMSDPFPWPASWSVSWPADWSSWPAPESSPGLRLIHLPDQFSYQFPGQLTDPSLGQPLIHLLACVWSISLTTFLIRFLASWLIHLLASSWVIS